VEKRLIGSGSRLGWWVADIDNLSFLLHHVGEKKLKSGCFIKAA